MSLMTSLVCVGPGQLEKRMCARPERKNNEVRVKIRRIGICGTDFHIYEGKHPFLVYPRVLGHELAGEIMEVPSGSPHAAGDHVIINPYLSCGNCRACRSGKPNCCSAIAVLGVHRDGGMCEEICLPEQNVIASGGLSLDACASVEFLAIGAHAVRRGAVKSTEQVLVVGAGPIGLGTALFVKLTGARLTIMDIDGGRLGVARGICGADHTLIAGDAANSEIDRLTQGEGFDVVFDATGNRQSMESGFDHVAHGGRYILVSVVNGQVSFSDPDFHKREMTLIGSRNATDEDFRHVMACHKAGKIPLEKIITHRTNMDAAENDLPFWAKEKNGLVKAMIEMD